MYRTLIAAVTLAVAAGASAAADPPKLQLSDPGLPIWELRPMDRRVYVVSLEGAWKKPATEGATHYLAIKFPNGAVVTHKPINPALFDLGEMRFLLQEYQLIRNKAARGGKIKLFVQEKANAVAKPETISNELEITWPLKRAIVRKAPPTKYTPPPDDGEGPVTPPENTKPAKPPKPKPEKPAEDKPTTLPDKDK